MSGDARRALDICRRAAENALAHDSDFQKLIGMREVDDTLQQIFLSPKVVAIRNAVQQEKLFLQCLLSVFTKSGCEEATLVSIWRQHSTLCRLKGTSLVTFLSEVYCCYSCALPVDVCYCVAVCDDVLFR